MTRKLRIEYPDAIYHAYARGNERLPIYYCDDDKRFFLDLLAETIRRFSWQGLAFCLMDNHYHLVIKTLEATLSRGMQWLNGSYSQWFNRQHNRTGHLFQGRFKDTLIQHGAHLNIANRYVVLNPVRAGLVSGPEQYEWSSYLATIGAGETFDCLTPDAVLAEFGVERSEAIRNYQSFVLTGIGEDSPDIYVPIFGDDDFRETTMNEFGTDLLDHEYPRTERQSFRPDLSRLIPFAEKRCGNNIAERNKGIVQAIHNFGYSQTEVAQYIGIHYSRVSKIMAARRLEEKKSKGKM
ncbi:MAG: transposase [Patescibacteria group bacterium]|nr:transposase [Patescibacteria group bacterium]